MKLLPAAAVAAAAARGAAGGGGGAAAAATRPLLGCHPVTGAPGPSLLPPSRAPALALRLPLPPPPGSGLAPRRSHKQPRYQPGRSASRAISPSPALGRPPSAPRSRAGLLSGRKRSRSGRLRLPAPTPPRPSSHGPSSPSHFPSCPAPLPASQHPRPGAPLPSSRRVGSTDLIGGARVPEPPAGARSSRPARLPQPTAGYVPA